MNTQFPTLVIHDRFSRCSACGGDAWIEGVHVWAPAGGRPCGLEFTAVAVADDANQACEVSARRTAAKLGIPFVGSRPTPPGRAS